MTSHNPNNERIKRRYFSYLKEAKRQSEPTIDAVAKALARFEGDTRHRDFRAFHPEQAIAFKRKLGEQNSQRSGEKLSKATINSTVAHLKRFFLWLAGQPGYRSRLRYSDSEYFNLSEKDVRIATAKRDQVGPTLEQVKHVIGLMPTGTDIQRRDRALVAFTLLTGARDRATASMKLKHVNLAAYCIEQDAREVQTKFSKTFTTYFYPVGEEIHGIFVDWVSYLRERLLFGNNDPLFPATRISVGPTQQFEADGLDRVHWSNAARIRAVFRSAFTGAGLQYFNPHSIRNTLVRFGESICRTPEEFKAWSQNMGHEKVLTTFLSYGQVQTARQGEIIRGLATARPQATGPDFKAVVKAVVQEIKALEDSKFAK